MKKSNTSLLITLGSIIVVVGGIVLLANRPGSEEAGQFDKLAQCLTDKGAKFYGAYWCPHCAEQKKQFGSSIKKIAYVECAIPGNNAGQTQACQDAKIENYPTWIFADGTRMTGVQRPSILAEKSGCSVE